MILTGNAGGNDHNIRALESLLHTIVLGEVTIDLRDGGDVGQIGGDAGSVDDIVERKVVDQRAGLEEEGQWLANATRRACDDCCAESILMSAQSLLVIRTMR